MDCSSIASLHVVIEGQYTGLYMYIGHAGKLYVLQYLQENCNAMQHANGSELDVDPTGFNSKRKITDRIFL